MTAFVIGASFLALLIAVSHTNVIIYPLHIQSYVDIWTASCEKKGIDKVPKIFSYSLFPPKQ